MPPETDQQLAERGIDRWGFPLRQPVASKPVPASSPRGRWPGRDEKIILGLRQLCAHSSYGRRHTTYHIARECGCDKETIRLIERRAIRKLRAALGNAHRRQIQDTLRSDSDATIRHLPFS